MTELVHKQFEPYLAKQAGTSRHCVYLIHGQEMLVEQSADRLVSHLLGSADRDICFQVMEGLAENIPDLIEELNTFALLAGPKIVLFKDAKIFEARAGQQRLIEQIAGHHESGSPEKAAKGLLQLCGRLDIDLENVHRPGQASPGLKSLVEAVGSDVLLQMANHCLDQGWQPIANQDVVAKLLLAIENGFPDSHHLIVAVNAKVPKNLKAYKAIAKLGLVVDCHVPTGERRADKAAQDVVLKQALQQQLEASGKKLAPGLFESLCRLTGFDLRTFTQNVGKLIDYSGERSEISAEDIHHVLRRTKSDPVFELTNALAERNTLQSLFFLNTLLRAKWHPLQILAAMANQVRKLLIAKDFAAGVGRQVWSAGMGYQQFQQSVMPLIQGYDENTRAMADKWQPEDQKESKGKRGAKKASLDVVLAPNPKSAYPVYQTLLKSERYTKDELVAAMVLISQSDVRLKSTGQDPAVVIKKTITEICNNRRTAHRLK